MNNKKLSSACFACCAASFILFSGQANATIYKCVNSKQETYYIDKPCPVSENETQLKNVKDPIGGYIPPKFKEDASLTSGEGVLIGKGINKTLNKSSREKSDNVNASSDGSGLSSSSDNSSGDSDSDDADGIEEISQSNSENRIEKTSSRTENLPIVPFKTEVVTREARDNSQYLK